MITTAVGTGDRKCSAIFALWVSAIMAVADCFTVTGCSGMIRRIKHQLKSINSYTVIRSIDKNLEQEEGKN